MSRGSWAKQILLWVALLAVGFFSFRVAASIGTYYPAFSLRYNTPITAKAAAGARAYAVNLDKEGDRFWPTFWSERSEKLKTDLAQIEAPCIFFSGDGALVWPAAFRAGGYPGAVDTQGCAVSETLAWRLWGSMDVVGNILRIGEKNYTVRGVFSGKQEVLLVGQSEAGEKEGWQAVELSGQAQGDTKTAAQEFAKSSGLGEPDSVISGPSIAALASGVVMLLPFILMIKCIFGIFRLRRGRGGISRELLLVGILVLFALALPDLLTLLPARFVPTRWSDFDFWSLLGTDMLGRLRGFLQINPHAKDVEAKMLLLQQGALLCGGLVLACYVKVSTDLVWRKGNSPKITSLKEDR